MKARHVLMFLMGISAIIYSIYGLPNGLETDSEFLRTIAYVVIWSFGLGVGVIIPAQEISRNLNKDD